MMYRVRMNNSLMPDRIRYMREQRVLTQGQLAELVGVHRVQISRIEMGRQTPRAPTIQRIAAALGVSPEWLKTGMVLADYAPRPAHGADDAE